MNKKSGSLNKTHIASFTLEANDFCTALDLLKQRYIDHTDVLKLRNNYLGLFEQVDQLSAKKIDQNKNLKDFHNIYLNLEGCIATYNEEFFSRESIAMEAMFSDIDGKKLDQQQEHVVMTNEENTLVLAGAGSGKTLTISAKVKYLVNRLDVSPEEILLISFTKASAIEMTERIQSKLGIQIEALTFHKLGLDLIKRLADTQPDITDDDALGKVLNTYFKETVLADENVLANIVKFYSAFLAIPKELEKYTTFGEYLEDQSSYDLETIRSKVQKSEQDLKKNYRTLQFEKVKSLEEVMIANFLYLNGIEYEYEKIYPYREANSYNQYKPDFYLPESKIYLEHFGISKDNRTPWLEPFEERKYLDGIKWKRETHEKNNTKLIETYSYYNKQGILLKKLDLLLRAHDVKFQPIDLKFVYEKIALQEKEEQQFKEFKKLISTFITLFKSNGYQETDFNNLIVKTQNDKNPFLKDRALLFLDIVKPIFMAYEERLSKTQTIDFNDMINMATTLVETKRPDSIKYKYIIIDEFQDISMGRYRLVKALKDLTQAKILAVGDDWQSVYRFAGSDLQLFVEFEKYFGYTKTLKIEQTYRNSQQLIDVASKFVLKNSIQLKKDLYSNKRKSNPIRIYGFSDDYIGAFSSAVDKIVAEFGGNAEIMVIGRNNLDFRFLFEKDSNKQFSYKQHPKHILKSSKYPKVQFKVLTAHQSKGLEADNVIVVNLRNHLVGFPNKISDDPLLSLVLTDSDRYDYAEERRLFYVATTRTKNNTYLIAPEKDTSIFVEEFVKHYHILFDVVTGEEITRTNPKCPYCQTGRLVIRENGATGEQFLGCSNFPGCKQKLNQIDILKNPLKCEKCAGYMVKRSGKYGRFYGCTNYPICRNSLKIEKQRV